MANQEPIAEGLSLEQWRDLLQSDRAKRAQKALDYYDGEQYEWMCKLLSDPLAGRKSWQERGLLPRFRNVTRSIVEKSGKLFKDVPPVLEVYDSTGKVKQEAPSEALATLMNKTEWVETFTNLDSIVRLLKTGLLLVQWHSRENRLVFDILHRGNTAVVLEPDSRAVSSLIYRTSEETFDESSHRTASYRIITRTEYIDFVESKNKCEIVARNPNPYGFVPVVEFYDTNTPRNGFWVDGGHDLVALNELVNLHITDGEYAISWAKLPTLFTNCRFTGQADSFELAMDNNSKLPSMVAAAPSVIGGPSRAIQLDSQGVDGAFVKYESPKVDIAPMNEVVDAWIKGYAMDWSVRIHADGEGRAESGFQLIVEELPNLELRKQRQRMFEAGMRRFFNVIRDVAPVDFPEDVLLFATFDGPDLPLDEMTDENVWTIKIDSGRASLVDYFMAKENLSELEAIARIEKIKEYGKRFKEAQPVMEVAPTAPSDDEVVQQDQ